MLKNDYLVVKIGVDTAENEPFKSAGTKGCSRSCFSARGTACGSTGGAPARSAATDPSASGPPTLLHSKTRMFCAICYYTYTQSDLLGHCVAGVVQNLNLVRSMGRTNLHLELR